ncbi:MAG: hypothetical protein KAJ07_09770 [Planctomycetes bacterium]|nr:hypothetical protein [Planctomycetota bacterium]
MTEQQTTKKPSRASKFFKRSVLCLRWLFIFIFAALTLAGLFFQAPWKVITLFAIFLVALTIPPKRFRKYFWLTVTCIVIGLAVWVFIPETDSDDWKPYTFDDELAALEAKRAIPDDQNAAAIYNELMETYDSGDHDLDFLPDKIEGLTYDKPWTEKDSPELAQWIKDKDSTIELLVVAATFDQCYFPVSNNPFDMTRFDYKRSLGDWAQLLIRSANYDLGQGLIDKGLNKTLSVFQIAKHVYQQSSMIHYLSAVAIENMTLSKLNRIIIEQPLSDEQLELIEHHLQKQIFIWTEDWPRTIDYEKWIAKQELLPTFYQVNPNGETRFSHDPMTHVRNSFPADELPEETWLQKKLYKLFPISLWFTCPPLSEISKIIDDGHQPLYAMTKPDYVWKERPIDTLRFFDFSTYLLCKWNFKGAIELMNELAEDMHYMMHNRYLETLSRRSVARIIIALKRFKNKNGYWPKNLEDIKETIPDELFIDPINGEQYIYKLNEDNFTIYSTGKNKIDEDGQCQSFSCDPNDFDSKDFDWQNPKPDDKMFWSNEPKWYEIEKGKDNEKAVSIEE